MRRVVVTMYALAVVTLAVDCDWNERDDTARWSIFTPPLWEDDEHQDHVTVANMASSSAYVVTFPRDDRVSAPAPLHELAPNKTIRVGVHLGDRLVVRTVTGSILHAETHHPVTIRACSNASQTPWVACPRGDDEDFTISRWTPPDAIHVFNPHDVVVGIYYAPEGECEQLVARVSPRQLHHLQSTVGHTLHFRRLDTGVLLDALTLREAMVTDLLPTEREVSHEARRFVDELTHQLADQQIRRWTELRDSLAGASASCEEDEY